MKFKKDNLGFIPVGGSEQIGMNANLYQFNDQWILVDLGIAFPDETQIGVDILLPDFDFIKKIKNKLLGIFLPKAPCLVSRLPHKIISDFFLKVFMAVYN